MKETRKRELVCRQSPEQLINLDMRHGECYTRDLVPVEGVPSLRDFSSPDPPSRPPYEGAGVRVRDAWLSLNE